MSARLRAFGAAALVLFAVGCGAKPRWGGSKDGFREYRSLVLEWFDDNEGVFGSGEADGELMGSDEVDFKRKPGQPWLDWTRECANTPKALERFTKAAFIDGRRFNPYTPYLGKSRDEKDYVKGCMTLGRSSPYKLYRETMFTEAAAEDDSSTVQDRMRVCVYFNDELQTDCKVILMAFAMRTLVPAKGTGLPRKYPKDSPDTLNLVYEIERAFNDVEAEFFKKEPER